MTKVEKFSLINDFIRLEFDAAGNLLTLVNLKTGSNYAGGQGIWRIIYSHDDVIEDEISAKNCIPEIIQTEDKQLRIYYPQLQGIYGIEDFSLLITITLKDDELSFFAELNNNSTPDRVIREFNFPTIKNINIAPGQALYGGSACDTRNVRIDDIPGTLQSFHTQYMADDAEAIDMPWTDNGFAMFANSKEGLYLGDHDTTFETTGMLFRKRGKSIDAGMHRSPFLRTGGKYRSEGLVISLFCGDWHTGAKKYRRWSENTWYKPRVKPASISMGFNGWYRLIMRHQYGKILFRHDEMPRILRSMKETGIDSLLIFGWWDQGMDAGYPEYRFDESQGGKAALKKHFQQFRSDGGKILLYFNGRLMDTSTEFYKKQGKKLAIRGCDGEAIIERYMFSGPGINLRHHFGYKSFALACTCSDEWLATLKSFIDTAVDLEVDGIFFDQIGMPELPCFSSEHHHPVPLTASRAVRMEQLKELRNYLHSRNPQMSMGIECATNFTSCFADYYHSFPGWNVAANDWKTTGEKPRLTTFIELFRYTFPEALISDREIRDDQDIERRVNLALLRGLVSDVEVHRCRSLIDETPLYKIYLTQANRIRNKYRHLIINGHFQDTDGVSCSNTELCWSVFTAGNELAVIATQSHQPKLHGVFEVPGFEFCEYDGIGDFEARQKQFKYEVILSRHGLIVMVFKRSIRDTL